MSRYEYDVEQELDDSFYPKSFYPEGSVRPMTGSERLNAEKLMKDMMGDMRSSARKVYQDLYYGPGSRSWEWELSLPGGDPIKGQIIIPEDEGDHPDVILKKTFEKLFPMVKAQQAGGSRFVATFEGRPLGKFDVEPDRSYMDKYTGRRVEVDMWGRPRYYEADIQRANRQWEHLAQGWLRQNLILKIKGLDQYHPPYGPQKSRAREDARLKDDLFRQMATQAIARPAKPKDPWRPVNEGAQNMARGGVNLSVSAGGGATNMAHATQMQKTSVAGKRVEKMGNSGVICRMDKEGTVIG